jgi:LmbE family N-acetylglucosaminyl deacetylase
MPFRSATVLAIIALAAIDAHAIAPRRGPAPTIAIGADTRLLVVAPHPDDEVLGAGGLMQRVAAAGGAVHVVYLTDGDGYPEGVETEDKVVKPSTANYRDYGRLREREARRALRTLKLEGRPYTFLSFPDGGLYSLMKRYWSERRKPFTSPYSRRDRPPLSEVIVPHSEYRGQDLSQELTQIIGTFHPTVVLFPRKEDQHSDHCAASYFVNSVLTAVKRDQPALTIDRLNYIIHHDSWPFEDDEERRMPPPPGLNAGVSGWIEVTLTESQQRAKRDALKQYTSQMHVMDWFLEGFERSTEVFSRPAPSRVVLPVKRSACDP